jgi:hypothetical protein
VLWDADRGPTSRARAWSGSLEAWTMALALIPIVALRPARLVLVPAGNLQGQLERQRRTPTWRDRARRLDGSLWAYMGYRERGGARAASSRSQPQQCPARHPHRPVRAAVVYNAELRR